MKDLKLITSILTSTKVEIHYFRNCKTFFYRDKQVSLRDFRKAIEKIVMNNVSSSVEPQKLYVNESVLEEAIKIPQMRTYPNTPRYYEIKEYCSILGISYKERVVYLTRTKHLYRILRGIFYKPDM